MDSSMATLGTRGLFSRVADGNSSLRFGGQRPTAQAPWHKQRSRKKRFFRRSQYSKDMTGHQGNQWSTPAEILGIGHFCVAFCLCVKTNLPVNIRLFPALYFLDFYSIIERADTIAKELDAGAKRKF